MGTLGNEELYDDKDSGKKSGFSIGGKNSGKGIKATSSTDFDTFTGLDATAEATNSDKINNGKRPRCAAVTGDRPHPKATHTVKFKNHPKFGDNSIEMCDQHLDQYQYDPNVTMISKLGVTEKANNAVRRRAYLRSVDRQNQAAEEEFKTTGTAPLLQTSGRPKVFETQESIDKELEKDYKDKGLVIDHVTPVIEEAAARGGRTEDPYALDPEQFGGSLFDF
jgi:hypothetical protein